METCKTCNGDGWHYAGDGVMYECNPCNSTGQVNTLSRTITPEAMNQVQEEIKKPAQPFLALIKLMRRKRG